MAKPVLRSEEMKQILNAIARMLMAAAKGRAAHVTRTQGEARMRRPEVYSANAGGWN
jgi:hypothetical protein